MKSADHRAVVSGLLQRPCSGRANGTAGALPRGEEGSHRPFQQIGGAQTAQRDGLTLCQPRYCGRVPVTDNDDAPKCLIRMTFLAIDRLIIRRPWQMEDGAGLASQRGRQTAAKDLDWKMTGLASC